MNRLTRYLGFGALAGACVIGSGPAAFALGFRNADQGAAGMAQGEAFVAQADDASAIYYNPGGLTQLSGTQVTSGILIGFPSWKFSSAGGNDEMDQPYFLPNLYAVSDFGLERWRFGLGINVPFGNQVEYSGTGPLRYSVTSSKLAVFNFAPTVAYQFNEHFSAGASLNIYHGRTTLNRLAPLAVILSMPGLPDGRFHFEGDGNAVGATVGALWKINEHHSIGAVYRAPFNIDFDGHAVIPNDLTGFFGRSPASAEIEFPQSIALGYAFWPTEKLKLEFDIEWTNWDTLNNVVLHSPNPSFDAATNPTSIIPFHWEDSFFYEFGAQYEVNEHWILRAGYIFSENSVPDNTFSASIPDSDRHVFSAGVAVRTKKMTLALTYQFSLSEDRDVVGSPDSSFDGTGDADGHWETSAHAIMGSSTIRF